MEDPTRVAAASSSNVAAGFRIDQADTLGPSREKVAAETRRRVGKKVVREYTADFTKDFVIDCN